MSSAKIKGFFAKLRSKKHFETIIAIVAVVVMLVLYFSVKSGSSKSAQKATSVQTTVASDYCEKTEQKLIAALESMSGVGKVKTVISWESGVEKVIAYATNSAGNTITTTPTVIQTQGSSGPIVLKELYPKALGVIIICQGGNNVAVKLDVMQAVSVLLDISQNKINVYPMR